MCLSNVFLIGFHFFFTDLKDVRDINNHVVKTMAEVNLYVTSVELDTKFTVCRLGFLGILFNFKHQIDIKFFYHSKLLLHLIRISVKMGLLLDCKSVLIEFSRGNLKFVFI